MGYKFRGGLFRICLCCCLLTVILPAGDMQAQGPVKPALRPFAVLELFTSQGCSSCPPADKLLGKIIEDAKKNNKPVYAMGYHVDYWNKYGWKDPYSSMKYSLRQRNYVSVLRETQAYTPQLVVNGETSFVGSDEKLAYAALEKALKTPAAVELQIEYMGSGNDTMTISYSSTGTNKNYYLKVAMVEKNAVNAVSKGENSGKTLQHHNVVTHFSSFDLNKAQGEVKVPLKNKKPGKDHLLIAFVQHRQTMKILGATGAEIK